MRARELISEVKDGGSAIPTNAIDQHRRQLQHVNNLNDTTSILLSQLSLCSVHLSYSTEQ